MDTLCGTNIYLVGDKKSQERIMIDTGDPKRNQGMLANFKKYFEDMKSVKPYISTILITHSHIDKFFGLYDVLQFLKNEVGQKFRP